MKKIFALLAIASMMAVACGKDNNDPKPDNGEYVKPIEIDGDFSDWAKLDSKKVAASYAVSDEENPISALTSVKVYADAQYVFIYFKFDKDQIEIGSEEVPFHIYINGDNDESTGGFDNVQYKGSSTDVMMEGFLSDGTDFASYDPSVSIWVEPDPNDKDANPEWSWSQILPMGSGVCTGAGKDNEYEIAFVREMYPVDTLSDEFTIGFDIQLGWESVGILPNAACTADNASGLAPMLKVVTVK
ncbi:MAG: hypothetical protein J5520_02200 [Bacteroidales bacterium]|nr:hypothetical protein [Bacteroidales bacterium]